MLPGWLVKRLSWFVTGSVQVLVDPEHVQVFKFLFAFTVLYLKNVSVTYSVDVMCTDRPGSLALRFPELFSVSLI